MIQKTLKDVAAPDGIIHTGDAVLFYSRYTRAVRADPGSRLGLHTHKVGTVGSTGRVRWSPPTRKKDAPAMRVGNDCALLERGGPHRFLVTVGDRMRLFDQGLDVGVSLEDRTNPKWAVRTSFVQPYPADVLRGPKGGYYVRPDARPPVIIRATSFDPPPHYYPRVELVADPGDRCIVRRGADGELYAVNRIVMAGEHNFFTFPKSTLPGGGGDGTKVWGGCTIPGLSGYEELYDFDVSPCGRTVAVTVIVKVSEHGGAKEGYGYERQLWLYEVVNAVPVALALRTKYAIPCGFVSFSPDGLTLATVGNNSWLRCGPMETLTVLDLD